MAFPSTPLDLTVEAAFGADPAGDPTTWTFTDLSERLTATPITIDRGKRSGAAQAAAATARIPLKNDDGELTPNNPLSGQFPNVRRNLPVRVHRGTVHRGAGGGSTTASTSHVAPSVEASKAGMLVCAWLGAAQGNYTLPGSMTAAAAERDGSTSTMRTATQSVSAGATGTRTATFSASQEYASASVVAHGTSVAVEESLSAVVNGGAITITTDASTEEGWWLVAFQAHDFDTADALPDAPNDDFGGWLPLADSGLLVVDPNLYVLRMRVWARRVTAAGAQQIRFGLNQGNILSDNHAAVIVLSGVDNWSLRFPGFVGAYRPALTPTTDGTLVVTSMLEAGGLLRRLERRTSPLLSAPVRYIPGISECVAFWPLEDGPLTQFGKPLVGTQDLGPWVGTHPSGAVVTFARFGQGELAPWLPPVVSRSGDAGLTVLWAKVSMPTFVATAGWSIDYMYASGTDAGNTTVDINPQYLGYSAAWPQLILRPSGTDIQVTFNGEPEVTTEVPHLYDGQAHHIRLRAFETAGPTVVWAVYIDGVQVQSDSTAGAMSLPAVFTIGLTAEAQSGAQIAQGYVAIYAGAGTDQLADAVAAAFGYRGETAGRRIERLCHEEGIRFHGVGDLDATEEVGPQGLRTVVDLLREAEEADGGTLFETRTDFALTYMTRAARYNRPVQLTVDLSEYATTSGTSRNVLAPVYDDQQIVNDMTVGRFGGAAATYQDLTSIEAEGRYDDSVELNVADDTRLADQAAWRVHLGTVNANRFSSLPLDLGANSDLIDAWQACEIGARVQRTNPPSPEPPDVIDQVLEGYSESLSSKSWKADGNASPAAPWTVGVWDDDVQGKLDTAGSVVAADATSTATTIDLATTSGPLWSTDDAEAPFDLNVGGERVTVTDVAASLITYGAVGSATHADDASVTPGAPAGIVAGNLLLVLAAIRNSGSGRPVTPGDYERLPVFSETDNVQLFAKIAVGGDTAPLVGFTGGAGAGTTTSAQMVRVAGKFYDVGNVVLRAASCLNVSGQDITYPGLTVWEDNALVLYIGWKQDDYTSVTSPGTEIAEASTTTGNDQSLVWARTIQTARAHIQAGSFVVTGGLAAISRAAVVAIRCDRQTATVTRSVNGVVKAQTAGTDVRLWTPAVVAL